jgi:2-polyprenyl-3-methyl-5-hydroxy-6-metoxy-1,4-benzoquinol methylase
MFNRLLNKTDLQTFKNEVFKNNWETDFPHIDLWTKDDAILKWVSVLKMVKNLRRKNATIVDLGCGSGCVPHIIASWGHNVTGIDIANINHFCNRSLAKMILNDVLVELRTMEEESVDVFIDVCAVTHFNISSNAEVANSGWKEVAELAFKALKPNGYFIVSTDVNINNTKGEFISPKTIIEIVESSGLELKGPYDIDKEETDFEIDYNGSKLQVAALIFQK